MASGSENIEFSGADDNKLAGQAFGDPRGMPVLLLHGGGQTRHAWGNTAEVLADAGFHAIALDSRGHGDSDWAADADYSAGAMIRDLASVMHQLGRPAALVGASMSGGVSLLLEGETHRTDVALSTRPRATSIVLVDAGTRLEFDGAMRIRDFMTSAPDGYASLEEAADAIAAYLPNRPPPSSLDGLRKNLRQGDDGRWRWHWDPQFMDGPRKPVELIDTVRLDRAAARLEVPVLVVRGRLSEVVSEEGARHMVDVIPDCEFVDVSDAGHMVAGDRNDAFCSAVVEFLSRVHANERARVRNRRN